MNAVQFLRNGWSVFPRVGRYAFAIALLAASIAVAGGFFHSPLAGFLAAVAAIIPAVLVLLFVSAQGLGVKLNLPALLLAYFVLLLFCADTLLLSSCAFFDFPKRIDVLLAEIFHAPNAIAPKRENIVEKSGHITLADIPDFMKDTVSLTGSPITNAETLSNRGTLRLKNTTLTLDSADGQASSALYLYRLEMVDGSRIIMSGNNLQIVASSISVNDGKIISFPHPEDPPQLQSQPGQDAGSLTIDVFNPLEGQLIVNLPGQNGSAGGKGTDGAGGAQGAHGDNGSDSLVGCNHGGGNGGQGASGLIGDPGKPGGAGGNGGNLILGGALVRNHGNISFAAPGGKGGAGGPGGKGGPGGPGGDGGHGSTYCSGGGSGPTGAAGHAGDDGEAGSRGRDGHIEFKPSST